MDTKKTHEVIAELRMEAAECLRVADFLEARLRRSGSGAGQNGDRRRQLQSGSYLSVAIDVLREEGRAMHIKALLPKVGEKMGKEVERPNVEGALARGVKSGKVKRPRPSTYALP